MIRTILVILILILFFILTLPLLLIGLIIGLFNRDRQRRYALAIIKVVLHLIRLACGLRLEVKGRDNIPADEAVLYIGNHRSYFDIVIGYLTVRGPAGFVAKKSLASIPIFGQWMGLLGCLGIDRNDVKQGLEVIKTSAAFIKEGTSIIIFPEGTRNNDSWETRSLKGGSFKIATKAACKIVPMALSHVDEIFEQHIPWIKSTRCTIEFGAPIDVTALSRDEIKQLPTAVLQQIDTLRAKNEGRAHIQS